MSQQKTLRVLHIMSGFGGGISSFIRNKAEALVGERIIFDIVTYDPCAPQFVDIIRQTGGDVYTLRNPKKHGWRAFKASYLSVLKSHHYDVIHCHISGYRVLPYYILSRKYFHGKFYIHAHLAFDSDALSCRHRLALTVDQCLNNLISDAKIGCGRLAIESCYGMKTPVEEMVMIPNSISAKNFVHDPEIFKQLREAERSKYGIDEHTLLVGQVARLMPVKNHQFTFDIARKMAQLDQAVHFLLIGAGELAESLNDTVSHDASLHHVSFAGRVENIAELYPALDCIVLPSFREGLPTVLVETQAAGIPSIVSDLITKEVDLDLGLIQYLPIDQVDLWVEAIINSSQTTHLDGQTRLKFIEENNFTNQTSATLYLQFLRGAISSYTI